MKFKIPQSIIISFIKSHFDEMKETSTGEIRVNTPFDNDTKFHLYINPTKGVVKDFKTGYGNDFITFVSDFLDINKQEVLLHLIKEYGKSDITLKNKIEVFSKLELPEGLNFFSIKKNGLIRNIAYNYLMNRKISKKNIEEFGYVFEPSSEYHNTIFIPFYENNEIVYFTTRDFTGKSYKRYINPHDIDSKRFVYNIDKMKEGGTIFIFEGVFDALMLDSQIGTAMLSSDLGKEQAIKILDTAPKNIIFVPDNDEAGEKSLRRNIKLLLRYSPQSLNLSVLVYNIIDVNDFGETGKHYIDINECKIWKDVSIDKEKFKRKEII